ncbi:MAG: nucleotidyltransferase domain-containing protein [Pseudomonadota bacterium]
MDGKIAEAIEKFRFSLEEMGIKVKRVIIFGSYAAGKADEDSDIDVVVISEDFKNMDLFKRLEIIGLALARAKVMEPIEALGYTEEEYDSEQYGTFIGDEVKSKGVVVV